GFVLVSAGFDCDHRDPLGGMEVTPAGFATMARACVGLAAECAGGRIAAVLEGGYDLAAIVEGVDATLAAMRGAEHAPPPVIGAAACPPVSCLPSERSESKPTHTPARRSGVKPMNQASCVSLVVPVLPATGRPSSAALRPVPCCTTVCSMLVMTYAVAGLMTR